MADTDTSDEQDDTSSLEMPSFSLRRRKKPAFEDTAATPVVDTTGRVALAGLPAAAVTGVVVGGLAVFLTWLATSACDVVRGTASCGGGPGLLILVAVLVALAYAGSLLLRVLGVPDAGSTGILATGLLAVLVLLFLLGSLDEWYVVVSVPVASVVAFCTSWALTHAVAASDPQAEEPAPQTRDVR